MSATGHHSGDDDDDDATAATPCDRADYLSDGEVDPAHSLATVCCDDCGLLLCGRCDAELHADSEHQRLPLGADEDFLVDVAEEEFIERLDSELDSHTICQRLFKPWSDVEAAPLQLLTVDDVAQLHRHGFVVLPRGFLGDDATAQRVCAALRVRADQRHRDGQLKPPGVHMEHDPYRDVKARGDFTGWLSNNNNNDDDDDDQQQKQQSNSELALVFDRFATLQRDLAAVMRLDGSAEKQIALYADPGAGYSRHRDALPDSNDERADRAGGLGVGKQRRVTAILYTSQDWQPEHGGCLRVFPTPAQRADQTDISPDAGKLLVFLSGAMWHEVLPSYRPRVAITYWFW